MGKTWSIILLDLCYVNSYMAPGCICGVLFSCSSWQIIHPTYALLDAQKLSKGRQRCIHQWVVLGMDPLLSSPFNTHLLSVASTVPHQLNGASNSTRLMDLLGGLKIQHRKVLKSVSGSLEELPPLHCPWAVFCGYEKKGGWSSHKSEHIRVPENNTLLDKSIYGFQRALE